MDRQASGLVNRVDVIRTVDGAREKRRNRGFTHVKRDKKREGESESERKSLVVEFSCGWVVITRLLTKFKFMASL